MTSRMYMVNKRTGHVTRIAGFSYENGWRSFAGVSDNIDEGFSVTGYDVTKDHNEWEIGYEDHPDVQRYLNYRHPIGMRH